MKISAVIVSRNDNYGGNLKDRATYCINSAIETYDEVFYVDWNSQTHSLFYDIEDNLKLKGNLNHVVITPEIASQLTNYDPNAQKCCEVLARNIGLRRATGDWIVSTNIDIIAPKRKELEKTLNKSEDNTFYTISRRHLTWEMIEEFHGGKRKYDEWEKLRDHLIENSEERHLEEKTVTEDDYSIINCCGDFQISTRYVWDEIRGMEEELIYPLYADTNVQKKAAMHGFNLKALYNPALFHIDHGKGGGGFLTGINKLTNNPHRAITHQIKTQNPTNWGFADIDIEYETI
mgnify:FL=1